MRRTLFFLTLLLTACSSPNDDDGGGGGNASCQVDADCGGTESCNESSCMEATLQGWFMCSGDRPCPAGQFCFNGLCAIGCLSDGDCANDQYCDTEWSGLCHARVVPGCTTDADCAANQTCVSGLCSAVAAPTQCTPRPDGADGCDDYSVCLEDDAGTRCVSFPPCDVDGACPVGIVGSVCNEGDLPNKAHICLTGLCKTDDHCPNAWSCVMPGGSTLGLCSDGSLGMPCMSNDDCGASLGCTGVGGGMLGLCTGLATDGCSAAGGTCIDPLSGESCPSGTDIDGAKSCPDLTSACCL